MKAWQHFKTITRHRALVRKNCFRVGLYRQGLTHDLSKFTPTEFRVGAKYFQGNRSPNGAERQEIGWSTAWIHHKGRNRHHFEYWNDLSMETRRYESVPMPRKYVAESVMDRNAACRVYEGEKYTDSSPVNYLDRSMDGKLMHPQTYREMKFILTMLKEEGETKTFSYIKHHILKGKPYPWEENTEE
jgi:hypothetical protein